MRCVGIVLCGVMCCNACRTSPHTLHATHTTPYSSTHTEIQHKASDLVMELRSESCLSVLAPEIVPHLCVSRTALLQDHTKSLPLAKKSSLQYYNGIQCCCGAVHYGLVQFDVMYFGVVCSAVNEMMSILFLTLHHTTPNLHIHHTTRHTTPHHIAPHIPRSQRTTLPSASTPSTAGALV